MTHALHDRFLRGLGLGLNSPAIRVGPRTMSFATVHELALRLAGDLLARSENPPGPVGVLADRSADAYIGILAALYAGATVVPLHPDFPAVRTRRMLEASATSVLLADEHGRAALAETGLEIPVLSPRAGSAAHGHKALDAARPVRPGDVAYILFTSGSTGRPKGVPITHGSLDHYFGLIDRRYDFAVGDVFSQILDLNFDCAIFELFCAWGAGATVCAVPPQAYTDLPAFFAERGVTVWFSTPSAIALTRRMGGLSPGGMPTLRWSFFAGEALRGCDAADWQAAAAHSTVENLYGPTELTITVTRHRWSPDLSPELCVNGVVPIGEVHDGHDHLLLAEDGKGAPAEGELCIAGPQMTPGYLDPEDNPDRFLKMDGRTWYRTGNRVRRLGHGELAYLGRLDAQVQIQGLRVELAEIDQAVRECAEVEDAVTVTRQTGRGLELVVFYTGTRSSPVGLTRQLRLTLPAAMLPREFWHMDSFPLNSNRKIDRVRLRSEAAHSQPSQR